MSDMVQIPKGRLQSLELVFKAASEFYTAYYNSSVRMENVAPGNNLAIALDVVKDAEEHNDWESVELERQINALHEHVEILESERDEMRRDAIRYVESAINAMKQDWGIEYE